jgi:zinc transporter, ZIP family
VPEQLVLGIGIATGDGVSVALLAAIFVSNLPEVIGSASAMESAGTARNRVVRLWIAVAVVCALASVVGFAIADAASSNLQAAIEGFAAGALLVMLIDSMIPEAVTTFGRSAGLVTTFGFALPPRFRAFPDLSGLSDRDKRVRLIELRLVVDADLLQGRRQDLAELVARLF